jgi:hypothetical protein
MSKIQMTQRITMISLRAGEEPVRLRERAANEWRQTTGHAL